MKPSRRVFVNGRNSELRVWTYKGPTLKGIVVSLPSAKLKIFFSDKGRMLFKQTRYLIRIFHHARNFPRFFRCHKVHQSSRPLIAPYSDFHGRIWNFSRSSISVFFSLTTSDYIRILRLYWQFSILRVEMRY